MAKKIKSNKQSSEKKIALERINILLRLAEENARENHELSNRYVGLARKISMRQRTSIPPLLKRRYCKHCHNYFVQGLNCRVRLSGGHVTYSCLVCKKHMRFKYIRERKAKRALHKTA